MIDVLRSRRMIIIIVALIFVCTIIVIIEEWLTNSQVVISTALNQKANYSQPSRLSENQHHKQQHQQQQQQIQPPPDSSQVIKDQSSAVLQQQQQLHQRHPTSSLQSKCWLNESYDIIAPCSLCSIYELETSHSRYHSNIHLCSTTGYKELVECSHFGLVERACATNWRGFLTFLSLVGLFGGVSGLLAKYRQYQLYCKSLARFRDRQRDLSRDSASSNSTLIDMNHTH